MGGSWIEIDGGRLLANLRTFRERLRPGTRVMAVVKANAYGHGARLVAPALRRHADWFGVDALEEAVGVGAVEVYEVLSGLWDVDEDASEELEGVGERGVVELGVGLGLVKDASGVGMEAESREVDGNAYQVAGELWMPSVSDG